MRHVQIGTAALLAAVLLAVPSVSAPKKNKDLDKTTEKMIRAGQLVGKVASINESKKSIRIAVTMHYRTLNEGAYNAYLQAQLAFAQARLKGDVAGMRSAQLNMIQQSNNMYTVQTKTQDYELATIEDVVVRMAKPRQELDEKGKPKRLTKEELKELKGDPKLPGYKAEFGDLAQDQLIQVHLVRKKGAAPKPVRKAKGKEKDDLDVLADYEPKISRIVILQDVPSGGK